MTYSKTRKCTMIMSTERYLKENIRIGTPKRIIHRCDYFLFCQTSTTNENIVIPWCQVFYHSTGRRITIEHLHRNSVRTTIFVAVHGICVASASRPPMPHVKITFPHFFAYLSLHTHARNNNGRRESWCMLVIEQTLWNNSRAKSKLEIQLNALITWYTIRLVLQHTSHAHTTIE